MASSNSVLMSGYDETASIITRLASGGLTTPSVTGIHHTLLGSRDWPAADQDAACDLLRQLPDAVMAAYQHREFVQRAALFLARQAGIRQFVAIGISLHQLAGVNDLIRVTRPRARVLYVNSDPADVSRPPDRLALNAHSLTIRHDLGDPHGLIRQPAFRHFLKPDAPAAILLAGAMHFVPDDHDASRIVRALMAAVPPGSYLLLSHATDDEVAPAVSRRAREVYRTAGASFTPRSHASVAAFFDGLDVLPPGVVAGPAWRPGWKVPSSRRTLFYAGLARKPRHRQEPLTQQAAALAHRRSRRAQGAA